MFKTTEKIPIMCALISVILIIITFLLIQSWDLYSIIIIYVSGIVTLILLTMGSILAYKRIGGGTSIIDYRSASELFLCAAFFLFLFSILAILVRTADSIIGLSEIIVLILLISSSIFLMYAGIIYK